MGLFTAAGRWVQGWMNGNERRNPWTGVKEMRVGSGHRASGWFSTAPTKAELRAAESRPIMGIGMDRIAGDGGGGGGGGGATKALPPRSMPSAQSTQRGSAASPKGASGGGS